MIGQYLVCATQEEKAAAKAAEDAAAVKAAAAAAADKGGEKGGKGKAAATAAAAEKKVSPACRVSSGYSPLHEHRAQTCCSLAGSAGAQGAEGTAHWCAVCRTQTQMGHSWQLLQTLLVGTWGCATSPRECLGW
jgi:hypothetical protein